MDVLDYARKRVEACLAELDRLGEAEFPHDHSRKALEQLKQLFQQDLQRLSLFTAKSDRAIIRQTCRIILGDLFTYVPLMGFVLRSTNVRNAFEIFGPFLRLAGDMLEPSVAHGSRSTKLLLSSEWDFSPLAYPYIPALPDFLFIGLPAPESSNPLLIPLAGHELGHALWLKRNLETTTFQAKAKKHIIDRFTARWPDYVRIFQPPISSPADLTTNLLVFDHWRPVVYLCLSQAEETFCDIVGLRLFRESYLHAFSYLLSPGTANRVPEYPSLTARVTNLCTAATAFGVHPPAGYVDSFEDAPITLTPADEFRLSVADEALALLVADIVKEADAITTAAKVADSTSSEVSRIVNRFKRVTPAENCRCIADILNAAWQAYLDPTFWNSVPAISAEGEGVLKELTLKNLEIFEIEQIQRAANAPQI